MLGPREGFRGCLSRALKDEPEFSSLGQEERPEGGALVKVHGRGGPSRRKAVGYLLLRWQGEASLWHL